MDKEREDLSYVFSIWDQLTHTERLFWIAFPLWVLQGLYNKGTFSVIQCAYQEPLSTNEKNFNALIKARMTK